MMRFFCIILVIAVCSAGARSIDEQDPFLSENENSHLIFMHLKFMQVGQFVKMLSRGAGRFLSKHAKILVDTRSNGVWVDDDVDRVKLIDRLRTKLDVPVQQIKICARIVSLDRQSLEELGVQFGAHHQDVLNTQDGFQLSMPALLAQAGGLHIMMAKLAEEALLDVKLFALEKEGHAKLMSSPELITANHQTASIETGSEVPYQQQAGNGATSVSFKKAVLSLKVTPNVLPNGSIVLHLSLNQDKLSDVSIQGVPAIQTRKMNTDVVVKDRQTVALGGINEKVDIVHWQRVPWVSHIPYLGALFRKKEMRTEQHQLFIFVTPILLPVDQSHPNNG